MLPIDATPDPIERDPIEADPTDSGPTDPAPIDDAAVDAATLDAIQAATFRRLLQHLVQDRPDVQNIDLMIGAGFCRNCLADWYAEAAQAQGIAIDKAAARDAVYGGDFAHWKTLHQGPATPAQLAALAAATHPKPQQG